MTEKRQPWGKWYWGDWRKDARLRRCSYGARGLWADMLSLMGGECDHYGVLIMEGQALAVPDLVGLLGGAEREVAKLLSELEGKNVFSRVGAADMPNDVAEGLPVGLPAGTIVSRRMIRDKAKEAKDRENGKRGGNPNLPKNPPAPLTPPVKAQKPEARNQKPEEQNGGQGRPPTASPADATPPQHDLLAVDGLEIPLSLDRTDHGEVVKAWNAMAKRINDEHGDVVFPLVAKVTTQRRRAITARLKDVGGLEGMTLAVERVAKSRFLRGENKSEAHKNWKCDFDFIMTETQFTKLMEGKYDDRQGSDGTTPDNGFAALAAEAQRRLEERDR